MRKRCGRLFGGGGGGGSGDEVERKYQVGR